MRGVCSDSPGSASSTVSHAKRTFLEVVAGSQRQLTGACRGEILDRRCEPV
jgi:hypothetical protein